jgi:hypothetical protein
MQFIILLSGILELKKRRSRSYERELYAPNLCPRYTDQSVFHWIHP